MLALRCDEGLTLETSAFQNFQSGNSTFINLFDKTKFLFLSSTEFRFHILCVAKKFYHIIPLLKGLHWLPIREELYFRLAVLVFKCMMRCGLEYLTSKLVRRSAVSIRNTRNSQLLVIPLFCTASGQRTFQYRVSSLWNELPLRSNLVDP